MLMFRNRSSRLAGAVCGTLAGFGLTVAVGCSSPEANSESPAPQQAAATVDASMPDTGGLPSKTWPREDYYKHVLPLMTNDERMEFHRQINNYRRDLYLREIGADARLDLKVMLDNAATLETIRGEKVVDELRGGVTYEGGAFSDEEWDAEPLRYGQTEVWSFKRFNGRGYTRMSIELVDGQLAGWHSYSEQDWIKNEQILAECSTIEQELKKVLEAGMAMSSIQPMVERYSTAHGEMFKQLLETQAQGDPMWRLQVRQAQFEAKMKPIFYLAEKINPDADPKQDPVEAYALRFKEPTERRFEGRQVFWRYEMPFGERKIEYVLVFIDRELKEWYAQPAPERNEQGY